MGSKLFVGNLRFDATREELESLFSQAGNVSSVALPIERETGRPRGFAFVEFSTEEEAKAAIERFNGYDLRGRQMRVNAAEDRPPRRPGAPGGGGFAPRPSFGAGGSERGGFGGGGGGFGGGYADDFGGGGDGGFDRGGYGGGGGGKNKGSRRNLRAKKRSL